MMRYVQLVLMVTIALLALAGCSSASPARPTVAPAATAAVVATLEATPSPSPSPEPTASPTPQPPPEPTATPSSVDSVLACGQRLLPTVRQEQTQLSRLAPLSSALARDLFNPTLIEGISTTAAEIAAIDVSLEAVTCEPAASELLSLLRAASKANADGAALTARGARGGDIALVDAGTQKFKEAAAIVTRATALLQNLQ